MTVTSSIVPTLTRADLLALAVWNAAGERCRAEYDRDPFAATREEYGESDCWRCRDGRHGRCTSRARWGTRLCTCWLDSHEPEAP